LLKRQCSSLVHFVLEIIFMVRSWLWFWVSWAHLFSLNFQFISFEILWPGARETKARCIILWFSGSSSEINKAFDSRWSVWARKNKERSTYLSTFTSKLQGRRSFSSSHHPSSNGQVRLVTAIIPVLKILHFPRFFVGLTKVVRFFEKSQLLVLRAKSYL
jgi:hypothetical protein